MVKGRRSANQHLQENVEVGGGFEIGAPHHMSDTLEIVVDHH